MIDQLDRAQTTYDDALARVIKGEQWLKDNKPTHPQYQQAKKLLTQRKSELGAAWKELDVVAKRFTVEVARERGWNWSEQDQDKPPSLNCQVCGLPVHSWPPPIPGHYVHFGCSVR